LKKIVSILYIIAFFYSPVKAQDIHLSQFFQSPLNLNPALTGSMNGDFRLVANERTQWRSITVPYQTYSGSFDATFNNKFIMNSKFGVGLIFNNDKAGDSEFGTNQIRLSGAYHQSLLRNKQLTISVAIDGGFTQNTINYSNLYFGSQYDGNKYDPDLDHGEIFTENQLTYIDYTLGGNIHYKIKPHIPIDAGIAFTHLNQPDQSFDENSLNELDRRYNLYAKSTIPVSDELSLVPSVLYMDQGRFQELDIGGYIKYNLNHPAFQNIYLGGWGRFKDAGILYLGIDYKEVNIGLSYDINMSDLRIASNGQGGLELSIIYLFSKARIVKLPETKKCPTFM